MAWTATHPAQDSPGGRATWLNNYYILGVWIIWLLRWTCRFITHNHLQDTNNVIAFHSLTASFKLPPAPSVCFVYPCNRSRNVPERWRNGWKVPPVAGLDICLLVFISVYIYWKDYYLSSLSLCNGVFFAVLVDHNVTSLLLLFSFVFCCFCGAGCAHLLSLSWDWEWLFHLGGAKLDRSEGEASRTYNKFYGGENSFSYLGETARSWNNIEIFFCSPLLWSGKEHSKKFGLCLSGCWVFAFFLCSVASCICFYLVCHCQW